MRKAFTLIEMLVVIAIISLLASFLLPAMKKALDSSRTTMCLSNQHQVGLLTLSYLSDNNGAFLRSSGPYSDGDLAFAVRYWMTYFAPYVPAGQTTAGTCKGIAYRTLKFGAGTIFYCPAGTSWMYYGWSSYIGDARQQRIVNPNKTMLMTDGSCEFATIYIWTGKPNFCHAQQAATSVLFCDMSAKSLPETIYFDRRVLKGSPYKASD